MCVCARNNGSSGLVDWSWGRGRTNGAPGTLPLAYEPQNYGEEASRSRGALQDRDPLPPNAPPPLDPTISITTRHALRGTRYHTRTPAHAASSSDTPTGW